jgi:phage shock protein E
MNRIRVSTIRRIMSLAIVVVTSSMILHSQSSQISLEAARAYLQKGAQVVDVRTPAEFSTGHLPNAINIPLALIESGSPLPLKNKKQVLLLHCKSGMRSAKATKLLSDLGYVNVFDLGSYSRATQIVTGQ